VASTTVLGGVKAGTNIAIDASGVISANDSSVAFTEITGKPTTLSGYGITDAATANALAPKASTLSQSGGDGTAMTFNWAGQGGQPSWLWGGNDGSNHYVYNPANFSVNYATTVGTSQFASSLGTNGYQKLPSGLIIQYGRATTDSTTFPLSFADAGRVSITTGRYWNSTSGAYDINIKTVSASGFTSFSQGIAFFYIAIGV
jgi:hypothetical protein